MPSVVIGVIKSSLNVGYGIISLQPMLEARISHSSRFSSYTMGENQKPTVERPRYVFFFTGATACGKSTIAKHVADNLSLTFLEGDDVRHIGTTPPNLVPKPKEIC